MAAAPAFVFALQDTEPLVELSSLDPTLEVELKYATEDNFMRKKLYSSERAFLRPEVAERLLKAHRSLRARGLGIKVLDAYRPLSVQREMFQAFPHPGFVADPEKGSNHNRAAAVDVTLVDLEGNELPMPSVYDEFTERSHVDYMGGGAQARENRRTLQAAMREQGFRALETEWWHFDDPEAQRYRILDVPFEEIR